MATTSQVSASASIGLRYGAIITVTPSNERPTANPDAATTDEDTPLTISVLDNDTDDGGSGNMEVQMIWAPPGHGSASVVGSSSGSISYRPAPNFNGTDAFTYIVRDREGALSDPATVIVTIRPVNDPPFFTTNPDGRARAGVLFTYHVAASDPENDALTISAPVKPGWLSLRPGSPGAATLEGFPTISDAGSHPVQFVAQDAQGLSAVLDFTVVVTVNRPPAASDDAATTREGEAVTIPVLANDRDSDGVLLAHTLAVVTPAVHGTTTINAESGTIRYLPAAGYIGTDAFAYTVRDNEGGYSNDATVQVTIRLRNDPPVAQDDRATTDEDQPGVVDVLANDSDPDGDALVVRLESAPAHGSAVVGSDNRITYTPSADFHGADAFSYSIDDDVSGRAFATATITVRPVNDAPRFPSGIGITRPSSNETIVLGAAEGRDPLGTSPTYRMRWNAATDPDGDAVTYHWQLSADVPFSQVLWEHETGSDLWFDVDLRLLATRLTERGIAAGSTTTCYTRMVATDGTGLTATLGIPVKLVRGTFTGVESGEVPAAFALEQNHPNPFNPSTTIRYALPEPATVTLRVFTLLGVEVRTLVSGPQAAGRHEAVFDASNLASGVYLYRIEAGSFVETRRMLLVK